MQVFPTGGMPRGGPPQPPPPPPPQQQHLLNGNKAATNASDRGKSPQKFEPPPFGCRPEIKIPPNPMATLRPVPKPKPKDDFWVEEYRKERSKSPMVQEEGGHSSETPTAPAAHESAPASSASSSMSPIPTPVLQQSHVQRPVVESERIDTISEAVVSTSIINRCPIPPSSPPFLAHKPAPASPQAAPQRAPESPKYDQFRKPEISEKPAFLMQNNQQNNGYNPVRSPSPVVQQIRQPQQHQQQPQAQQTRPAPQSSRWNAAPSAATQADTKPLTVFNNVSAARPTPSPVAPANGQQMNNHNNTMNGQSHQQQQQQPQKSSQLGTLYIPPVEPQDMYNNTKSNLVNQQTPNWMQSRHAPGQETPEWVNRDEADNGFGFDAQKYQEAMKQPPQHHAPIEHPQPDNAFAFNAQKYQELMRQQQQQPPRVVYQQQQPQQRPVPVQNNVQYKTNATTTTTTTQQEQTTSSSHRERIIPIQLEQTPTPTKCPTSPGFGPQPYYNVGQPQYSSVQSPGGTVYQQTNSPSEMGTEEDFRRT